MEENKINENINFSKKSSSDNNLNDNKVNKEKEDINKVDEKKLFYDSLIDLLNKKQYKKILKLFFLDEDEDEENEKLEESKPKIINESKWMLSYIEIISIQKIIQRKNEKYYKSAQTPKFKEYIKKENKIINKWLLFISNLTKNNNNKENIKCFLEFIITFILQKCINLSKHCIYQENYKEAVCFLSLGINLINHTYKLFKSPESFILCGEIFLFLSSILLGDNQYESAVNIISFSCKFFYISIESILYSNPDNVSYSIFNLLKQEENIYNVISKIFFYLSILFYNLGVYYENQGFSYSSYYAYKQSKYFSSLIKNKSLDIQLFYEFIKEIEKRQLMRNRIFIFFERFVKKEDLIDKYPPIKKVENQFFSRREKKEKIFNKLEKYISNLKLVDVDNDEPYLFDKINKHFKYNVNLATKQIHLLDYLMSNNFQEIINNMNKIRINKLDKETIRLIQRKIINIKNNEREKLNLLKSVKLKKNYKSPEKIIKQNEQINYKTIKTASSFITFNSCKKTRVSSSYKNSHVLLTDINNNSLKTESCFSFNSRPTTAHNDLSNKTSKYGYFSLKSLSNKNKNLIYVKNKSDKNIFNRRDNKLLFSSSSRKNVNKGNLKYKIPKYSYDKYLFSKSFMKKKKILENQYSNEIIFQKQLLSCKKHELIEPKIFNIKEIQNECDKFYFTTFEKELMYAKERNNLFGKKDLNNKSIKKKEKSSNSFLNNQKKKKILFNEYINDKSENKLENINKNNYDAIDKLFNEIVYLNEKGKIIEKKYGKT